MATRNFVPRADNEGGIGTALKKWAAGFFTSITASVATFSTTNGGSITGNVVYVSDGAGHYLRVPSLTTAERDALTPQNGMFIYNTTQNRSEQYENGAWVAVTQTQSMDPITAALIFG